MFRRILACSDGSDNALRALRVAAEIAKPFGSEVVVVSAFNPVYADMSSMGVWAVAIDPATIDCCARQQWSAVEATARSVFEPAGVPWRFAPMTGPPVEEILCTAEAEQSDLIVVGGRGMTEWQALLLGSVSEGVLHHARCSVLIARGDRPILHKILLATDGSECAETAAQTAGELTRKLHADLTVLNVFEPFRDYPDLVRGDLEPEDLATRVMEAVSDRVGHVLDENGIAHTLIQQQGRPAQTIVRAAAACNADLIVVGSRGLGAFKSMLLGSVSTAVAHHAPCSLLVAR
jgi:nucleotide-binding universal stress UspA family protein